MGKYSVKNINDFIYRSKEDSIFLHHIKTLFTEYMAEEKSPYEIKPLVEAHDRYEIVYLVSGKVGYRVDGVDYSLGSGDILIIPPGKIHRVCISTKEDYDRYNIQFHSDLISSPAMHLNNLLDELLNIGSEYLLHFTQDIVKKYALDKTIEDFGKFQDHEHNKEIVLIGCILNLAIQINSVIIKERFAEKLNFVGGERQRLVLKQIVDYVEQNLCARIHLDDIANALYMNKYYLSHYFKEKMGVSLKQYINMKKMYHADFLINNGNSPTAVAIQLGFSNYSTFYYAYKRCFKREPSKLRPYVEDYIKKNKE